MSRVGSNPVSVPEGVTVDIAGQLVTAKGKLGELSVNLGDDVEVTREDNLRASDPGCDQRFGSSEGRPACGQYPQLSEA